MSLGTAKPCLYRLVLAAAVVLWTPQAQARDLTVVGWGGKTQEAQRQVYFSRWQAKTHTPLVEDSYNGGLAKIKAMVDGAAVSWDVVEVEAPDLLRGCEEGLFEPLDWTQLGGQGQFIEEAASECGVGTFVWSTVLVYNGERLPQGPKSWADFWNVKKFPGKRALRKGAKFTLEIALLADGVALDQVYPLLKTKAGQNRAFKKLDEIKPYIQWWEAGAQPPEWLASGDVVMSSAYSGRVAGANKEGKDFRIVWDGQIYTVDSWAIVSGSPNKAQALNLISFMSDPENMAKYPEVLPYGPTHKAAIAKLKPEISSRLPTSAANMKRALLNDTRFWVEQEEDLSRRFNAWAAQ
jgi:putative spermidine/putrescine transport system substrate-binding protein